MSRSVSIHKEASITQGINGRIERTQLVHSNLERSLWTHHKCSNVNCHPTYSKTSNVSHDIKTQRNCHHLTQILFINFPTMIVSIFSPILWQSEILQCFVSMWDSNIWLAGRMSTKFAHNEMLFQFELIIIIMYTCHVTYKMREIAHSKPFLNIQR